MVGVKESSQILLKQLNWPSGQQKSVRLTFYYNTRN